MSRSDSTTRRRVLAAIGAAGLAGCSTVLGPDDGGATTDPSTDGGGTTTDPSVGAGARQAGTVRAFVGSYHWGYFLLDAEGTELSQLTLSQGEELRLTLFSVEADAAVEALPDPVRGGIPDSAERSRRNRERIPEPSGTTLETLHEAAEAAYPDHGLVIVGNDFLGGGPGQGGTPGQGGGPGQGGTPWTGPWGGHHGPHGGPGGRWPSSPGGPGGQWPSSPGGPGMWGGGYGTLAPPVHLWHHSTVPQELGFVVNTTGTFGFVCHVYCGYGHPYMVEPGRIVVNEGDE